MIKTKSEFYKLYYAGALGNKLRNWPSLEALKDSGFRGNVVSRYRVPHMPYTKYNIPIDDLDNVLESFYNQGARPNLFNFNEAAPDDRLILQGECYLSTDGLYVQYSRAKLPMRQALAAERMHASRSAAAAIMRYALNQNSHDDLMILFDNYPESVVEFSSYERCLGDIPERNTVIWEVRNY